MSTPRPALDQALRELGEAPTPPPSTALEALVRDARPTVPRRPVRELGLLLFASLAILAIHVHSHHVRRDFAAVPKTWFWTLTGAWSAAFVLPLAVAVVPRRGAMFVDVHVARIVAVAVPALAIVLAVFLRVDAPPATILPKTTAATLDYLEWCLVVGLEMGAAPFALGVVVLRRAQQPLQTRWIGAALGAGIGALSGLMLHVHCWIGGSLHAGVAHAGQAVIGALTGALVFRSERRREA